MAQVRVWDNDEQWLWPNLPFLLRAHGEERVERCGGVDPAKDVDNDFAAVLIRPLALQESEDESAAFYQQRPRVSAEWYSADRQDEEAHSANGRTIVHAARSERFTIRFPTANLESQTGRLGVWLVYADFLGYRVPTNWPEEKEFEGGILTYLEVKWRVDSRGITYEVNHQAPPSSTAFDWAQWSVGPSSRESYLEW
jgi:hypothetical protein